MLHVTCCSQETASYDQAQVTLIDNVNIAAKDPGVIQEVQVLHGADVTDGQTLAGLDASLYRAERDASVTERKIAELQASNDINYRFAKKSEEVNDKVLERSRNARKRYEDSVSDTEIEQLELSLEQSMLSAEQAELEKDVNQLTVELRKNQEAIAEERLKNRIIESPLSGQVVDVFVQKGEWVNSGQPIARIVNLNKLRVKAVYSAKNIFRINKDSKTVFEFERNGKPISVSAKIYFISPEIDATNQDFEVWADVENNDRKLFPGMKGLLTIELDESK